MPRPRYAYPRRAMISRELFDQLEFGGRGAAPGSVGASLVDRARLVRRRSGRYARPVPAGVMLAIDGYVRQHVLKSGGRTAPGRPAARPGQPDQLRGRRGHRAICGYRYTLGRRGPRRSRWVGIGSRGCSNVIAVIWQPRPARWQPRPARAGHQPLQRGCGGAAARSPRCPATGTPSASAGRYLTGHAAASRRAASAASGKPRRVPDDMSGIPFVRDTGRMPAVGRGSDWLHALRRLTRWRPAWPVFGPRR